MIHSVPSPPCPHLTHRMQTQALRRALASLVLITLTVPLAASQELEPRHELGQRLIRMERAYAAATFEQRIDALPTLQRSVAAFFRNDPAAAGALLDKARGEMQETQVPTWLDGLALLPESRVVEAPGVLRVVLERFCGEGAPAGETCRLALHATKGSSAPVVLGESFALERLPFELERELPPDMALTGDCRLRLELLGADGQVCGGIDVGLSVIPDFETRLDAAAISATLANASLDSRIDLRVDSAVANVVWLDELYAGTVFEVDVPAAALLQDLESNLVELAPGRTELDARPPPMDVATLRERWLSVRVSSGELVPCRFLDAARKGQPPPPLIVALHGAGGSEHMVFDGFGAGAFISEARRLGWSVLAPRVELGKAVDVSAVVTAVRKAYRFDERRVALVGHSMGAALAIATVESGSGRYCALVALGGGRAPRNLERYAGLDVLAGGGALDFGLPGARALHAGLANRGDARLTNLVVPKDAEHLTVVQAALPSIFELLHVAFGRSQDPEPNAPGAVGSESDG